MKPNFRWDIRYRRTIWKYDTGIRYGNLKKFQLFGSVGTDRCRSVTGFRGFRKIVDWSSFVIVLPSSSSWVNFQKAPLVFVDYPPSLVVVVAFCVFSLDLHRSLQVFCKICSFFSSILNKLLVLSSCFCVILSCNVLFFFFGFGFLLFFCLWVVVVVLGRAGLLFGFCGTARVQGRRPPTEVCFGE